MTAKDIITIPNPMLRAKSLRIGHVDESIRNLASQMVEVTVDWERGREHETAAALAAVQIAQLHRVVIVRDNFEDKDDTSFSVYINPEIVKAEGEPEEELEGCLSVADIYGSVMRYPKVKIKAINLDGQPVRLTATGFLARVFQHEIDHTNGMVFVDRITDPHKLFRLHADGHFSPLSPSEAPTNEAK